mgnify:CR=1 FL=1
MTVKSKKLKKRKGLIICSVSAYSSQAHLEWPTFLWMTLNLNFSSWPPVSNPLPLLKASLHLFVLLITNYLIQTLSGFC